MLSADGLQFIMDREELRLKAYRDIGGVPSIGYGTTRYLNGRLIQMGDTITKEKAVQLLAVECAGIERRLNTLVTAPLTQNQRDALISFCYNLGVQAFAGSTLRVLINKRGAQDLIAAQFLRWNKAHVDGKLVPVAGLTSRRRMEAEMFGAT